MTPPQVGGDGHAAIAGTPDNPFNPPIFALAKDPLGFGVITTFAQLIGGLNSVTTTANRAYYSRLIGFGPITLAGFQIITQAGNLEIAVYANTGVGTAGKPGSKKFTTGSFGCPAAGWNTQALVGTIVLGDWVAFISDSAATVVAAGASGQANDDQMQGFGGYVADAIPMAATAPAIDYSRGPTIQLQLS